MISRCFIAVFLAALISFSLAPRAWIAQAPAGGGGGGNNFSLIANISAAGDTSITTASINTTGANLLVAVVTWYSPGTEVLSDSKGNTWVEIGTVETASVTSIRMFYVAAPTVGSGHTFTVNPISFGTVQIQAWSGANASPLDQNSQSSAGNQPGSITPTLGNELIVTGFGDDGSATTPTVDSGFTVSDAIGNVGASNVGGAAAWLKQTAAAAVNPTWSPASTGPAKIASFKP